MLTLRNESGYISVAEYLNLTEGTEISTLVITDCRDAELDFSGVRFAADNGVCHARPLVEVNQSSNCTLSNLQHQRDYSQWAWQDWANARNGILLRSGEGNGVESCYLSGIGFGVRALSPDAWVHDLMISGRTTDGLRICSNGFDGDKISIGECYWNAPEDGHESAEHADGIHIHPYLPPEEQHKGAIKNLSLKNITLHNHQQIIGQRWSHGLQVTDGRLIKGRFENINIHTDNSNGLVVAEAHDLVMEDVHVHSPDPAIESQICIGTRKPNYNASTNVWTRRCTADRWGIV